MFKKIFFFSLVSVSLFAEISLKEISSKPSSRAKNFLIWQYLKQDISKEQADMVFSQVSGKHYKITKEYLKKSNNKVLKYKMSCRRIKDLFSIDDKNCFKLALSPYKTLHFTDRQRDELISKVDSKQFIKLLKIQGEHPSEASYKDYKVDTVLNMFIRTTRTYRRENLDIYLSAKFMNSLANSKKIVTFIKIIIKDKKLTKLRKSLFHLNGKNINAYGNFILALYKLQHQDKESAIEHLKLSLIKAKKRINIDKASFWLYLISHDEKYINKLLLSTDINIYTLYAHDKKDKDTENYFFELKTNDTLSKIDLCDPFEWNKLLKKINETPKEKLFDLAKKYQQKNMLVVQSFITEKAYSFKMHGYIMPYEEYLKNISNDDKALVYSIMRQESNFIPSALSRSFALGLMQMMPFLVDAMSKKNKEKIEYCEMFQAEKNIKYALEHLKWMKKSLYHPLLMAYAYNGGMGFLRKHLKTGAFVDGEYEPYLSMELMTNSQSREYGKRVLANYIMYKKILNEEVSIINLLEILKTPQKTDRFER